MAREWSGYRVSRSIFNYQISPIASKAIYQEDLGTNSYPTGFNTNLHGLADQIMSDHDPLYNQ